MSDKAMTQPAAQDKIPSGLAALQRYTAQQIASAYERCELMHLTPFIKADDVARACSQREAALQAQIESLTREKAEAAEKIEYLTGELRDANYVVADMSERYSSIRDAYECVENDLVKEMALREIVIKERNTLRAELNTLKREVEADNRNLCEATDAIHAADVENARLHAVVEQCVDAFSTIIGADCDDYEITDYIEVALAEVKRLRTLRAELDAAKAMVKRGQEVMQEYYDLNIISRIALGTYTLTVEKAARTRPATADEETR